MRRDAQQVALRKVRDLTPPGHASCSQQVGLDDRDRSRLYQAAKWFHAEFSLTGGERYVCSRGEPAVAFQVVLWEWLFQPVEPAILDTPHESQCPLERETLVRIDQQF